MLLAWREIFSSGVGEGMEKKGREDVAISMLCGGVVVVCGCGRCWSAVSIYGSVMLRSQNALALGMSTLRDDVGARSEKR